MNCLEGGDDRYLLPSIGPMRVSLLYNLHFKRNGMGISGLSYSALLNDAVPEGYDQIILLNGVTFDTVTLSPRTGNFIKKAVRNLK